MRKLIKAGSIEEGDTIGGAVVTGLGRTWVADDEGLCALGEEPGSKVRVQYAYMEDQVQKRIDEIEYKLQFKKMGLDRLSKPKREKRERKITRLEDELTALKS